MEKISGRLSSRVQLTPSIGLDIESLDEAIFQWSRVVDYVPVMTHWDGRTLLTMKVSFTNEIYPLALDQVREAVEGLFVIQEAMSRGLLKVEIIRAKTAPEPSTGRRKRKILDYRREFF